jgi:hypothetical protein
MNYLFKSGKVSPSVNFIQTMAGEKMITLGLEICGQCRSSSILGLKPSMNRSSTEESLKFAILSDEEGCTVRSAGIG